MSLYLSRVLLDPRRRSAVRLLRNRHRMHAAILADLALATEEGSRAGARVLWRLDDDDPHVPMVLILTPCQPNFANLVQQAGRHDIDHSVEHRRYQPLLDRLARGDRYRFRLTANPTHSVRLGGQGPTQRVGHVTYTYQRDWFLGRQHKLGIIIPDNTRGEPAIVVTRRGRHAFTRDGRRVTLTVATYEGVLEVVDPVTLRAALVGGIGPAKAYGCGLMTLAPFRVG